VQRAKPIGGCCVWVVLVCPFLEGYHPITWVLVASIMPPPIDLRVEQAIRRFVAMISRRYDVDQVLLYGSRARGDHREDSDVDVAILLKGAARRCLTAKLDMMDDVYDVLSEDGLLISPLPIWLDEWNHPADYPNPLLLKNIDREGIRL